MRAVLAAFLLLSGCSTEAQASCRYDLYIYDPTEGAEIYALTGSGQSVAIAVRACGEAEVLTDAETVVERLRQHRESRDIPTVLVESAGGGRTYLGPCETKDFNDGDGEDMIVVANASARNTRRMINSLDAAPVAIREQMIADLRLQQCAR